MCYESCLIDEGGPLDAVFQEKASNHFKLLRLRDVVVLCHERVRILWDTMLYLRWR